MDSSVSSKDEFWFLRVCHHISNAVYNQEDAPVISNYLFFLKALYVSNGLSVRHQDLKTAYTATVYVKELLLPAAIGDKMKLQFHLIPDSSR